MQVGVLTIGYGHTGSDVTEGKKITEEEAENLLLKDVASFESAVNTFTNVRLNQNEYDALVSFSYNVGSTAYKNYYFIEKIRTMDVIE